mmetsp:Transcript_90980/g.262281  ORF Transcript_90980/g.262281 Transcript_90980/m.262281 type:complete len:216 (-) Transcript_90980:775-1422(-)
MLDSKVPKFSINSLYSSEFHPLLPFNMSVTPEVKLIPNMKNSIISITKTQSKDLKEPKSAVIIIRNSRKNRMMRITLATRTTRTTLMTRSMEVFCSKVVEFNNGQMLAIMSTKPNPTTTMSKQFQEQSSMWKKSMKPSATHRMRSSAVNSKQKTVCNTRNAIGSEVSAGKPWLALSKPRNAKYCAENPINIEFSTMSAPANHSNDLCRVIRCSFV